MRAMNTKPVPAFFPRSAKTSAGHGGRYGCVEATNFGCSVAGMDPNALPRNLIRSPALVLSEKAKECPDKSGPNAGPCGLQIFPPMPTCLAALWRSDANSVLLLAFQFRGRIFSA